MSAASLLYSEKDKFVTFIFKHLQACFRFPGDNLGLNKNCSTSQKILETIQPAYFQSSSSRFCSLTLSLSLINLPGGFYLPSELIQCVLLSKLMTDK